LSQTKISKSDNALTVYTWNELYSVRASKDNEELRCKGFVYRQVSTKDDTYTCYGILSSTAKGVNPDYFNQMKELKKVMNRFKRPNMIGYDSIVRNMPLHKLYIYVSTLLQRRR
jgi:hypothetical protein